jgi:transcriptional regulator with XRE-family HTH domain
MLDVGGRLRRARELRGLSQRGLAVSTGIDHSTVSLIERNRISPSIGVLKRLLDGVGVSLSAFFADDEPAGRSGFLVRREELTELANGAISLRQVGSDLSQRALQIMHECFAADADTGPLMLRHEGEEGGIVICGHIELTVDGESQLLTAGDAYLFESNRPHRFRNPSHEPAELISACTPPTF